MLEPWNDSSLLFPPVLTSPCNNNIDVNVLKYICGKIINMLSKQLPLHKESAIFSRLLYKFDKKFRNDIGYRYFKKVNTALRKYLKLNLLKEIEYFKSVLPSNDDDLFLPSRQILEYILIKLLAFSKIMLRICQCAKKAGIFYFQRVKRGENHWMCLVPFAALSRLWSICMVIIQHSCGWYSHLLGVLDKLQPIGLNFLPNDYKLPVNLEEWLDLKNIENCDTFQWSQKKFIEIDQSLVEDEDNDTLDIILKCVNQIDDDDDQQTELEFKPKSSKLQKVEQVQVSTIKNVDQGEVLSRESYKKLQTPSAPLLIENNRETLQNLPVSSVDKNNIKKDCCNHRIENVTNKIMLKKFITREETLRNESSNLSLTTHLSFMQWQVLKNYLLKLCESPSNKKIENKIKKIWKARCLDCS